MLLKSMLYFFLAWTCCISFVSAAIYWRSDVTSISYIDIAGIRPWNVSVIAQANGEFFREEVGHFRLIFTVETGREGRLSGESDCIELGASMNEITNMLDSIELHNSKGSAIIMSSILISQIKKYGNGKVESGYRTQIDMIFDSETAYSLSVQMTHDNCTTLRTVGRWEQSTSWVGGVVPNATSRVVFPAKSGVAVLSSDVSVRGLNMQGGYIIAQISGCAKGWSPFMIGTKGYKCFKLHSDGADFEDSIVSCKNSKNGALDAQLAQIESYEELDAVLHTCRSARNETPFNTGCWIGIRDEFGTGLFQWIEKGSMKDISFRDWRRTEELNRDETEGFLDNGKRCIHTYPWQEDPAIQEQGSWTRSPCEVERSYVCQHFASTVNINLTVTGAAIFNGTSAILGGYLYLRGASTLSKFSASHASEIVIKPLLSSVSVAIESIILSDASVLRLSGQANYIALGDAFIGETSIIGLQPAVTLGTGVTLRFRPKLSSLPSNAVVEARVDSYKGNVHVESGASLTFGQGGKLSSASIIIDDTRGYFTLNGYSARMTEYDSFDIVSRHRLKTHVRSEHNTSKLTWFYLPQLHNRGDVIGEYTNNIPMEDVMPVGVYRLSIAAGVGVKDVTRCIDYHSTAEELREILLEDSILIQQRGGVTVRRSGDGGSNFYFGYRYRVEIDAPSTVDYYGNPLTIKFHCSGIHNCGCAQTKIPLTDDFGMESCLRSGNISRTNPNSCVIPPDIVSRRITEMTFSRTSGNGNMVISKGVHRLPPVSDIDVGVSGGVGTVAADHVRWRGISANGNGIFIIAGKGWFGWDSSVLLYGGPDTEGRGLKRMNRAPPCNFSAVNFKLSEQNRILSAGPTTNITLGKGSWSGGIIGGRSTLFVLERMNATGSGKALQYGVTLYITENAVLEWFGGNISLSNGADIIVEGIFIVSTTTPMGFIGQAQLLSMPPSILFQDLLQTVSNVDFNGYFDDSITVELRTGWYMNPACGEQCVKDSNIYMRGSSQFIARDFSNSTFLSPLNLLDQSTFVLGIGGFLVLNAGGDCGNSVIMAVSEDSEVRLSGGSFAMQSTCTITGDGELAVVNGTHNLCFSINAHITISGGAMVWPQSRGAKQSLRFFGGLLIQGTGELRVEPLETRITVDKTVQFKDECLVQFPMIGIAAQPSLYDTIDAPDISPRGSLTATNIMRFGGGTLRGKADFNVGSVLYLEGGEKRIRSLAKLINRGHAEWSTGDIIMADQGDFVNLGSVQMSNGTALFNANMRAQGTVVPVESGGDVFALEFHSWDLDQGNLDFQEYVRLRTEFVSRAPDGWTEALQGAN